MSEFLRHTAVTESSTLNENENKPNQGEENTSSFVRSFEDIHRIEISSNISVRSFSEDQGDANPFGGDEVDALAGQNVALMPAERDAESYNMNHTRRGLALIFNHKNFETRLGLGTRNGTDVDRDNLKRVLTNLDFEVRVYEDLPFRELEQIMEKTSRLDHTDADCILIAVLTHGETGSLYAYDKPYKLDKLWEIFNGEWCPTLAGKPKIFFIEAGQGDQLDDGVHLRTHTETDSAMQSYKIPTNADFLGLTKNYLISQFVFSTMPGFRSWRNTTKGSWFIQALCQVMQRNGGTRDLLSNLTQVFRIVALNFQSNTSTDATMDRKKQIPSLRSMLTRDIFFPKKL